MSWLRSIFPFILLAALLLPRAECVRCERIAPDGGLAACCTSESGIDACCGEPEIVCPDSHCCRSAICTFPFTQCPMEGDPASPCRCVYSLLDGVTAIPLAKSPKLDKLALAPKFLTAGSPASAAAQLMLSNIDRREGRSPPPIPISSRTRRAALCVRTI